MPPNRYQRDAAGFGAGQSLLLEVVGRHLDVRGELSSISRSSVAPRNSDRTRDHAALMTLIYPSLRRRRRLMPCPPAR